MRYVLAGFFLLTVLSQADEPLNRRAVKEAHRHYFMSSPERVGELIIYDHFLRQEHSRDRQFGPQTGAAYESRKKLEREVALHRLNKALSEYRSKAPTLSNYKNANPGAGPLRYVDAALDVIGGVGGPKGKVGAVGGKLATQITRDVLREAIGPSQQKDLQKKTLPTLGTKYVDGVLDRIYTSKEDSTKFYAVSHTIGLDARAVPGESAQDVYSRHADLYNKLAIEAVDEKVKRVYQINSDMFRMLSENIDKTGKLNVKLDELQGYFTKLSEQQVERITTAFAAIRAEEQQQEQNARIAQMEKQAWMDGASTVVYLIGLNNKEMGQRLGNYVQGVSQIMDAVDTFHALKDAGKIGAAGVSLASGIIGGLSLIFSFLGPSELELVRRELEEIRKSIAELSLYMEYRFNVVDRRLFEIHKDLLENFANIRLQLNELEKKLSVLQMSQETAEIAAARRYRELSALLAESKDDDFRLQVLRCNEWSLNRSDAMEKSHYKFCLDFFYHCATQSAGSKLNVGEIPALRNGKDLIALLNDRMISSENIQDNLAVVGSYAQYTLNNASLVAPRVDFENPPERFPLNPARWEVCSKKYAHLALEYPELYQSESGRQLDILISSGKAIQSSFHGLVRDDQGKVRVDTFDRLFKDYRSALGRLTAKLVDAQRNALARNQPGATVTVGGESTILGTNSYDPFRRQDLKTPDPKRSPEYRAYQRPVIGVCDGVEIQYSKSPKGYDGYPKLEFPKSLLDKIPGEYKTAVELGIGTLSYCWELPRWTNVRDGEWAWRQAKDLGLPGYEARIAPYIGNLSVVIRLEFRSGEHSTGLWLRAVSKTDTAYGFHGHSSHPTGNPDRGPQRDHVDWQGGNTNWFFEGEQRGAVIEWALTQQWKGMMDSLEAYPISKADADIESLKNHPLVNSKSPIFQEIYQEIVAKETELAQRRKLYTQEFSKGHAAKQREVNDRYLSAQADLVRQHLIDLMGSEFSEDAKSVDVYRGLLEGYVALAFPDTLTNDARMRALFFGKHRIPNTEDIRNLLKTSELNQAVMWDVTQSQRSAWMPDIDQLPGCGFEKGQSPVSEPRMAVDAAKYVQQYSISMGEHLKQCLERTAARPDVLETHPGLSQAIEYLERVKGLMQ